MTLKPIAEVRTYRRNLPHIEIPGSVYFVTFRTIAALTFSDEEKDVVFESIKFHDGKKYILNACVVMNNHVHLIISPLVSGIEMLVPSQATSTKARNAFYSLGQITHSIKSYSANRIQKMEGSKRRIWLDENYDRVIRDEKELLEKLQYILNNPVKAGLVENSKEYKWMYLMQ